MFKIMQSNFTIDKWNNIITCILIKITKCWDKKKRENLRLFRDTLRGAMSCIYMKKSGSEEFLEDVSIHRCHKTPQSFLYDVHVFSRYKLSDLIRNVQPNRIVIKITTCKSRDLYTTVRPCFFLKSNVHVIFWTFFFL